MDTGTEKELPAYIGRTIRVFLSYSSEDKKLAAYIRATLEELGLEVFLAHEDIRPSSDWQKVILENLKSTDIFIPIITENFKKSNWTDQESGIAFVKEKLIIPIAVDKKMPYGFLGKLQAFNFSSKLPISAEKIIEVIIEAKPEFVNSLLDSLIKSFGASCSYDDAGLKSSLLLKFKDITKEQINEIFRSVLRNGQIKQSLSAHKNLNELFSKHQRLLDKKLLKEVKNKYKLLIK